MTLRHALAKTNRRVVELVPPAVSTALANGAAAGHGAPLDAFCDSVFGALVEGAVNEVGYGPTAGIEHLSRRDLDGLFEKSASRSEVPVYAGHVAEGDAPDPDPAR